jgi:hypothetical protein
MVILHCWLTSGLEIKVFSLFQSWTMILTRELLDYVYENGPIAMGFSDGDAPEGSARVRVGDTIDVEAFIQPDIYGRVSICK